MSIINKLHLEGWYINEIININLASLSRFFNVNNTIMDTSYFCPVSEVILLFLYSEPELNEHLMQM